MSEIKSALELALERTADVKSDKSSLEAHESKQTGMKLAGKFLDEPGTDVAGEIKKADRSRQAAIKEGFFQVMMSHLALPSQESDVSRLQTIQAGIKAVVRDQGMVDGLMDQVIQYLNQFLDTKVQLTERLREQFEPRLRQKEQQIAAQTGRPVRLEPENDPEFAQALAQNLQQLQAQYGQVVDQAKEQLEALFTQ